MITFNLNQNSATKPLPQKPVEKHLPSYYPGKPAEAYGANCELITNVKAPGDKSSGVETSGNMHGFALTVHTAYAKHYPLVLSPDSIWLVIAQGLAKHISQNSEKLRHHFVSHEGQRLITVVRNEFVKGSPYNDWQGCFHEFSEQISKHIGDAHELIVPSFSTTGLLEKAVSEITLMDSMQSYFKYQVMTKCGIPSVTLLGTVEDWESIRNKAEKFAQFDLDWWVGPLCEVLDKFVRAARGNIDKNEWMEIYKIRDASGGLKATGWITDLFPYVELSYKPGLIRNPEIGDRKSYGLSTDMFGSGLSSAPFEWVYYDQKFNMEFLGGFVGTSQDPETLALTPALGWMVREKEESNEK